MSVPTMGNRLGRHGQGAAVINVPAAYAQLTLEMAAAYLNFPIRLRPPDPQPAIENTEISDDDIRSRNGCWAAGSGVYGSLG